MKINEELKQKLKTARKELNLNQSEMATKLGIKQSYYSALERGTKAIGLNITRALVKECGVNAEWLYSSIGNIFSSNIVPNSVELMHSSNNSAPVTNNKSESKRVIFKRKLDEYLSKNTDIKDIDSAALNLLGFEYVLEETIKRHLNKILLIADLETGNDLTFEEVKEAYWKHIEELRPYKSAFINLSNAINTFYKEMHEAGDNWFDFAPKH